MNRRHLTLCPPLSHVRTRPRPYDWAKRDPELTGEPDATPAHGIDRSYVDADGWLWTDLG